MRRRGGGLFRAGFTLIEALAAVSLLALALMLLLPAFNNLSRALLEDNDNSAVAHVLENELARFRRSSGMVMPGRDAETSFYPELPQGSATIKSTEELYGPVYPEHPENEVRLVRGELRIVAGPGRECTIVTYSLKRP